jgi:dihydrolipoamide dehydrogenase
MDEKYDVLVIGAGPAGYVSAIRASQLGLRTAIIDKRWLGGVCLNVGCIPSKALLRNAEIAHILRERGNDFGFTFDNLRLDYTSAVRRSRQAAERLVKGVGFLMRKNNISVIQGNAIIKSGSSLAEKVVLVTGGDGTITDIISKNIIIATGAHAIIPKEWNVDEKKVLTYEPAILQEHLPASVAIIGAGAIGMEFATIWSSYGVDVTVIEMLPHILPLEDQEAATEITRAYSRKGVKFLIGHKVESIQSMSSGVKVIAASEGVNKEIMVEQALVAIGFQPNSRHLGLEEAGVVISPRGFIEIDERMETNIPGIWAIGDVTGKLMLAHVGSAMGLACAEAIAGREIEILNYEMMPRATYCSPQVASFGLTEKQAVERGHAVKIGKFPFQANGKAIGLADFTGWVKLVVDQDGGSILGATLVGPEVTELLPELTLAQALQLTTKEISRNIHAHPTLSEVLMEAAHVLEGSPIHI